MSNNDLDYEEIRRRADKRARKRMEFFTHLGYYIVIDLGIFGIFGLISAFAHTPWPMIVPLLSTAGWGIGLGAHAVNVYFETGALEQMREREYEREIQREMAMRGMSPQQYEKPKREQVVRLSDDGEMVFEDQDSDPVRDSKKLRGG